MGKRGRKKQGEGKNRVRKKEGEREEWGGMNKGKGGDR